MLHVRHIIPRYECTTTFSECCVEALRQLSIYLSIHLPIYPSIPVQPPPPNTHTHPHPSPKPSPTNPQTAIQTNTPARYAKNETPQNKKGKIPHPNDHRSNTPSSHSGSHSSSAKSRATRKTEAQQDCEKKPSNSPGSWDGYGVRRRGRGMKTGRWRGRRGWVSRSGCRVSWEV